MLIEPHTKKDKINVPRFPSVFFSSAAAAGAAPSLFSASSSLFSGFTVSDDGDGFVGVWSSSTSESIAMAYEREREWEIWVAFVG